MPRFEDPVLVNAARRGDPYAVDRLARVWLPIVLGWCARLGGPRVDPEDAASEVMIVMLNRLDSVRDPVRFDAWMFQVTRRVLAAQRRRAWIARWLPGATWDTAPDPGPDPADVASWSETSSRVREALESMSAPQREVFVLCDVEEHTDEEAAAILQVPLGTVKSRLKVARDKFRRAAIRLRIAPDLAAVAETGE